MTAIVDYGVGNLFSLVSSFRKIGEEVVVTADENVIRQADRNLLPGVGAFGDAAAKLRAAGLDRVLVEEAKRGKPLLGICLGMQLLFEKTYEYGEYDGLCLLSGEIRPIAERAGDRKIPHMGWNALDFCGKPHPLFRYIRNGEYVYFVHSYAAENCADCVIASSEYGFPVTAAAANQNVMGCQFHPEKSGDTGLRILKAFCEMKEGALC